MTSTSGTLLVSWGTVGVSEKFGFIVTLGDQIWTYLLSNYKLQGFRSISSASALLLPTFPSLFGFY